ncbi:MAG: cobalamin-dependent protein, partial [Candidatus Omnitrophica bacterium]|nr:cobalamin-dependent protein [Candidatus Omnitrophota bacterium]
MAEAEGFYIKKSDVFEFEVIVEQSFLRFGIARQREEFRKTIKALPSSVIISHQENSEAVTKFFKVLLFHDLFKSSERVSISPSALALGTILKKSGVDVHVSNVELTRKENVDEFIRLFKDIDMVCLTLFEDKLQEAVRLTSIMRNIKPDIWIALGGPAVTVIPEQMIAALKEVNIFFRGEAEHGFARLVDEIRIGKTNPDFSTSQGTLVRRGHTYHFNELLTVNRMTLKEINDRCVDFSLLDNFPLELTVDFPLMSAFGCPHRCTFCATAGGKKHRPMTALRFIEEMWRYDRYLEQRTQHGDVVSEVARRICLMDDNSLLDKQRAVEILTLFRQAKDEGLSLVLGGFQTTVSSLLKFSADGHGRVADEEFIEKVSSFGDVFRSGQVYLSIGVDSLREMDALKKGPYLREEVERVQAACNQNKILTENFMILTTPQSRIKDLLMTLLDIIRLHQQYPWVSFFAPGHLAPAVMGLDGTESVNTLIANRKTNLGTKEYDLYGQPDYFARFIKSPHLPQNILDTLINECLALNENPNDNSQGFFAKFISRIIRRCSLLWSMLFVPQSVVQEDPGHQRKVVVCLINILKAIDKNLSGSVTSNEEEWYKDLMDEGMARGFTSMEVALRAYGLAFEKEAKEISRLKEGIEQKIVGMSKADRMPPKDSSEKQALPAEGPACKPATLVAAAVARGMRGDLKGAQKCLGMAGGILKAMKAQYEATQGRAPPIVARMVFFVTAIATADGFRHPAFPLLDSQTKEFVEQHEALHNDPRYRHKNEFQIINLQMGEIKTATSVFETIVAAKREFLLFGSRVLRIIMINDLNKTEDCQRYHKEPYRNSHSSAHRTLLLFFRSFKSNIPDQYINASPNAPNRKSAGLYTWPTIWLRLRVATKILPRLKQALLNSFRWFSFKRVININFIQNPFTRL